MKIVTEFPRPIRIIENTWIPLSDGCRLAARVWLPVDAEQHPVPAVLEYIPYRKDDATALDAPVFGDPRRHAYVAGHGYATVRVDMRGSGDSDGILLDEYLTQEQDDALEILAWLAAQPWCTGQIGMMGISWGGFNSLQVAARRPPQLKAIITLCSTHDRYNDDCHYSHGCLLGFDMLSWASYMFAYNARPPTPRFVGERWRQMWLDRMEHTPPYIEAWLSHQRRDAYWKHGSVGEDYAAIQCPVYAVGGWADPYRNAVLSLLEGLSVPRKGLIGPWAHTYPERGIPGPAIGFLQESLRWWDHWLKGIDTGIMDEPMLRVWMQESVEPRTFYSYRPGRWVAEPAWPTPNVRQQRYILGDGTLDPVTGQAGNAEQRLDYRGAQYVGLQRGVWCPSGGLAELPEDQRLEDGLSLCFTSVPLEQNVEILGFPVATLTVSVDRPLALLAVRLCDVAPTGASTLLTWGLLNLTHRDSHEHPAPLEPGQRYTVKVRLNSIAHAMPAGHRWRLAVSPTYWPDAWPSPEPVTLSLFTGPGSYLELPMRTPRPEDAQLAPFAEPECAPPAPVEVLRSETRQRSVHQDVVSRRYELVDHNDGGRVRLLESGVEYEDRSTNIYSIVEGDPLSASVRCERSIGIRWGDINTRVETVSTMSADAQAFWVTNVLEAFEGETRVFAKTWNARIERDLI